MRIYDLRDCPLSDRNGTYGGNSGDKEGILINNEYWLVKYPKNASRLDDKGEMSYTTSPVSEYIGSHIYGILGYDVHRTVLGIRNGHIVVACKDLCDDEHRLIEFRQLKNTYNKTLNEKLDGSFTSTGSDHFVGLEEIMLHLKYNPSLQNVKNLKERFWDCVVVDGFINNNDRNNGNWGILRGKEGDSLAPVFDNGSSFSPNVSEEKIMKKISDNENLVFSACNGVTAYSINGKGNALFRDILKLDIPDLKTALRKNIPLIQKNIGKIISLIKEIPPEIDGYKIISKERKSVYIDELKARLERLFVPVIKRIGLPGNEASQEQMKKEKPMDNGCCLER